MRAYLLALATILSLTTAEAATAQPAAKPMADMPGMAMPASATKTGKGTGVITEIDAKAGTVTIKHQPIASLGWPAMTMGFKATPSSLLNGLKIGQKVGFDAKQAAHAWRPDRPPHRRHDGGRQGCGLRDLLGAPIIGRPVQAKIAWQEDGERGAEPQLGALLDVAWEAKHAS